MSILLAGLLDRWLREPPSKLHPVVWIGALLRALEERGWRNSAFAGAIAWTTGALLVTGFAVLAWFLVLHQKTVWRIPFIALLLWPSFSLQMLLESVAEVEAALESDLEHARKLLSQLVSRDTAGLDTGEIRMAALETLSENLADSLVAPLFYFNVLGLPGAWLYRYTNTADATWGYRTARYTLWGWAAARADDLLGWLPARLTACLLTPFDLNKVGREAKLTPSPNAGWPMAALALRLNVRLEKKGCYVLNPSGRLPNSEDVKNGLKLVRKAGWMSLLFLAMISWLLWGV